MESLSPLLDKLSRHVGYFSQSLKGLLPWAYTSLDTNRLTLLHFTLQSLKLLGALPSSNDNDEVCSSVNNPHVIHVNKQQIIDWIYHLQCTHTVSDRSQTGETTAISGFQGGTFLMGKPMIATRDEEDKNDNNTNIDENDDNTEKKDDYDDITTGGSSCCDHVHIAMTYVALCSLKTLGDSEFSRVNRKGIINSLRNLQQSDGSFTATSNAVGAEYDLRFVYCACCICDLLQDWSGINQEKCVDYILKCQSYDGSFGLLPGQEGHGGSTFCAIASLKLMGRLDELTRKDELLYWCVHRQCNVSSEKIDDVGGPGGGMQGRPNKLQDTCYSYWIGGTLQMLLQEEQDTVDDCNDESSSLTLLSSMIDTDALANYVLHCQTKFGGFSKVYGSGNAPPDLLHSFYSLAFLSLATEEENEQQPPQFRLGTLNCALGMSQ